MIIHCTTIEQIKDVIATERIKFNTHPKVMLNDFGDKLCINTKGGYGTLTTYVGDIISYSEWKNSKPTDKVKLSIIQCYKDSNITITKSNITSVHIRNPKYSTNVSLINFYIGENDLTISQANSIIKVMGLNYELTDSVDWSIIQVGTKLTFTKDYMCSYKMIVIFHSYIPQTNQIIVLNGNKVEVYNESEVSLCN